MDQGGEVDPSKAAMSGALSLFRGLGNSVRGRLMIALLAKTPKGPEKRAKSPVLGKFLMGRNSDLGMSNTTLCREK